MSTATDTRLSILEAGQRIMARKGWAAVGINGVLTSVGVPKGSFYHWFPSKEAFGCAMLARYFEDYLAEMDAILSSPHGTAHARLLRYWESWRVTQSLDDCQGRCLAVKLGAEVADLSEPLRLALQEGTAAIIARVADAIESGRAEGSIGGGASAAATARSLYSLWLGASVLSKIHRHPAPLTSAEATTRLILSPQ